MRIEINQVHGKEGELRGRTILFSNDSIATKLVADIFKKKIWFLEIQSLDAFNPADIIKQDFNKIIVDIQDVDLGIIKRIKKLDNKIKENNLNIELNFLASYINPEKHEKIFELTDLGEALFRYAQKLQLKSLKDNTIRFHMIIDAYVNAAQKGSIKARQWIQDGKKPDIKPSSFWTKPYYPEQVNNRFIWEGGTPR